MDLILTNQFAIDGEVFIVGDFTDNLPIRLFGKAPFDSTKGTRITINKAGTYKFKYIINGREYIHPKKLQMVVDSQKWNYLVISEIAEGILSFDKDFIASSIAIDDMETVANMLRFTCSHLDEKFKSLYNITDKINETSGEEYKKALCLAIDAAAGTLRKTNNAIAIAQQFMRYAQHPEITDVSFKNKYIAEALEWYEKYAREQQYGDISSLLCTTLKSEYLFEFINVYAMHQLITPGVNKYTPTFKTVLCFISKNNLKQLQEFVVKYDKYPIYKELIAFV